MKKTKQTCSYPLYKTVALNLSSVLSAYLHTHPFQICNSNDRSPLNSFDDLYFFSVRHIVTAHLLVFLFYFGSYKAPVFNKSSLPLLHNCSYYTATYTYSPLILALSCHKLYISHHPTTKTTNYYKHIHVLTHSNITMGVYTTYRWTTTQAHSETFFISHVSEHTVTN